MHSDSDHQRYKALFDSTAVGICILDVERRIHDANDAFCRLLGRERDELVGALATDFLVSDGRVPSRFEELSAGNVDSYVIERGFRHPDGSIAWTRITTSAMSADEGLYVSIVEDMRELNAAERRLRERTALLNHAQQIAGVGSWAWYPHENRNVWSPEAQRIYGIDEVAAETGDPQLFFDAVHPDDRDEIMTNAWDSFRAGRASSVEHRVRHRDGERWVRAQAEVELDADGHPLRVLGVVMDITEQKRTEAALAEKAEYLARAQEAAKIGSFTVDVLTRRLHMSAEMARMYDLPGEATFGIQEFRERFIPEDDRDAYVEALEAAYRRGGKYVFESRTQRASGKYAWMRVHGNVEVDEFGRPVRAVGVLQDVTEQRRLDEQMRETQKMQAVGLLASGVAHDFNNLLLVIGANAQLALAAAPTEVKRELEEIAQATERGVALVRTLLGFSRRSAGEQRDVDVNDIVRTVRRMLERLTPKAIEVEVELGAGQATVMADPNRLEQALLNLAVNARDAMPNGGRITLSTETCPDGVAVRVSDTGIGMDDATRARVFEPFFTTKASSGGTGLGLATVYATVDECGGSIEVESEPGHGTTFTVVLPTSPAETEPEANAPEHPAETRILLVEDEAMVRTVSAQLLTRAGYVVDAVACGEEALQRIDEGAQYDVVVSDFMMPKMTGLQLMAEVGRRGLDLPVVYTSGYADSTVLPENGEQVHFVAKPFSGREVRAAIEAVLRR